MNYKCKTMLQYLLVDSSEFSRFGKIFRSNEFSCDSFGDQYGKLAGKPSDSIKSDKANGRKGYAGLICLRNRTLGKNGSVQIS